jgi:hypothetical protein
VGVPEARGTSSYSFQLKKLDICPQTSKAWKAHMSITATAVVKKETKVDPKKPEDKVHYASLSVLNEDSKEYGLPRHLGEFREVAVLLKPEAGVTHEQLHERFAAYERGEEIARHKRGCGNYQTAFPNGYGVKALSSHHRFVIAELRTGVTAVHPEEIIFYAA